MNILAHIYLSGNDEETIVGNFIGDHVKGKAINNFNEGIQRGIYLHRFIDFYTDNNQIIKDTKRLFQDQYGKYSGIVVDIIFDHILSNFWNDFSDDAYESFIKKIHGILNRYEQIFPTRVKRFYPYFIENDWLLTYRTIDGIERVLAGMSRRTSLPDHTSYAMEILKKEKDIIAHNFTAFFNLLVKEVKKEFGVTGIKTTDQKT